MASPMLLRLVEGEVLELTSSDTDILPEEVANLVGSQVRELRTRGDGACALHAVFGTLPELLSPELHLQRPRSFLRSTLGQPLEVIRARVRAPYHTLLETVLASLWEFALNARVDRPEEQLFCTHLQRSPQRDHVLAGIARHRERQQQLDIEEAVARQRSASIFRCTLESFWRGLTLAAGVDEEYTSPPWEQRLGVRVVKGTCQAFVASPDGGPLTKFQALFDTRAVFDALRVSFLRATCGPRLERIEHALGELLASEEQPDAEGTAALLEYLDRCRDYFDPARAVRVPEGFEASAWPSFVASICDESGGYFLSADELMLVCELRQQNIAIFGRRQGQARFLGAVTGHASPLVLVVLHLGDAQGRVRSHFQRLALVEDIREAEEQQRREAEEARERRRLAEEEARLQLRELSRMSAADLEADAWRALEQAPQDPNISGSAQGEDMAAPLLGMAAIFAQLEKDGPTFSHAVDDFDVRDVEPPELEFDEDPRDVEPPELEELRRAQRERRRRNDLLIAKLQL